MSPKKWLIRKFDNAAERALRPHLRPLLEELRRANLQSSQINNPVMACGKRYFSQNDEDGILLEILRRIEVNSPSVFLEFGVGNGTENNTIILLALGWRGAWADGRELSLNLSTASRLAFSRSWITRDNAAQIATDTLAKVDATLNEVIVASIDLDGNDTHVVRSLLMAGLLPEVFIVEYNSKFPPEVDFEMPYRETHKWRGARADGDYYGASLRIWCSMLSDRGYFLVGCNENGVNAFFVHERYKGKFSDVPTTIAELYRPGHYFRPQGAGHRTSPETVRYFSERTANAARSPRSSERDAVDRDQEWAFAQELESYKAHQKTA